MVVRCTWHQRQAPATLCWLQTSEGRDIRATFAPSSEKPEGQKGISYRLQPPYNHQPVSRDLTTMLLRSFCNLKDLVRIYSEPQHGWTPPRGQCYQEERDIQRSWFHNSVQMFPDARIVTQQTSGPHVLPPIHSSTRHPRSPCRQEQNTQLWSQNINSAKCTLSEQRSLCIQHLLLQTPSKLPLTPREQSYVHRFSTPTTQLKSSIHCTDLFLLLDKTHAYVNSKRPANMDHRSALFFLFVQNIGL